MKRSLATTRKEKALDRHIAHLYWRHSQGMSINMLDIPKLYREVRTAVEEGQELEAAVVAAVARHCSAVAVHAAGGR